MVKSDIVFIQHIKDAISAIQEHVHSITRKKFMESKLIQDAVVREIEIIGEASNRLSIEFQEKHPSIPWHAIIGMRNQLIHGYFEVDLNEVWKTIEKDIPELEQVLKTL